MILPCLAATRPHLCHTLLGASVNIIYYRFLYQSVSRCDGLGPETLYPLACIEFLASRMPQHWAFQDPSIPNSSWVARGFTALCSGFRNCCALRLRFCIPLKYKVSTDNYDYDYLNSEETLNILLLGVLWTLSLRTSTVPLLLVFLCWTRAVSRRLSRAVSGIRAHSTCRSLQWVVPLHATEEAS